MSNSNFIYHHDKQELHGFVTPYANDNAPRPGVLVVHDWTGCHTFAIQKAQMLAELGYVGFAVDMYGNGRTGSNNDEKMALMQPLMADRAFLRARIQAAFDALIALPQVDSNKIAVIGFCFGGLCALDLARSGAAIKGVVSFHGLLGKAENLENKAIQAKILVLHGYDDPMVKPDAVNEFCKEMTAAKVDWQVHMYGNTQHAFTNPEAHDKDLGTVYNPDAEVRSLQAMSIFLREVME